MEQMVKFSNFSKDENINKYKILQPTCTFYGEH